MKPPNSTGLGLVLGLVTLVATAVAAVWSARDHAERSVQRIEDKFESIIRRHEDKPHLGVMTEQAHARDVDRIAKSLDRIHQKLDEITGKCNCMAR